MHHSSRRAKYPCPNCSDSTPDDWCANTACKLDDPNDETFDSYQLLSVPICYYGPSDDGVDETSTSACGSWDPESAVTYTSGVFYVVGDFVEEVIDDPTPLITCDDARFDESSSPQGFEVQDSDLGEFLYALGLRNGDVLVSINSLSLETYTDVLDTLAMLYLTQGETSLSLRLLRGSSYITLDYEIQ
ncbi:MAG: hypothetical protein AB1Z98_38795 [Nannocystaceae bacterium]